MWFMSLDPCWVPIPSGRMLSLCARANKHLQPNPSAAREKQEMLSWWQKQPHCQKWEESFPDYSSLQIHWFNFNPQIKQWEWYIGYSVFGDWVLESRNAALQGRTQGLEEVGCIFFHFKLGEVNSWWKCGDWWLWKLQALLLCGTALAQTVSFKPDLALPDLSVTSTLTLEGPSFSLGKNSLGNRGKMWIMIRSRLFYFPGEDRLWSIQKLDILLMLWYSRSRNLVVLTQH